MCGASLRPGSAAREERKVVTVLFCDLVGFTAKAEQLDPEDVRAVLAPVPRPPPRRARAPRRHGGEVHRRRGDGALRRAGRARGRSRARGSCRPRHPRLRGRGRTRAAGRGHHRRGARLARRQPVRGRRDGVRRRRQHGGPTPERRPVNGILADETTYRATRHDDRVSARRPGRREGQGRADLCLGGDRGARALRRRRHAPRARRARRPRARASTSCGSASIARAQSARRSSSRSSASRHRQEPARVRALATSSTPTRSSSPGARAAASPTATGSRSGRWPRSSRRRPASSRRTATPKAAEKLHPAVEELEDPADAAGSSRTSPARRARGRVRARRRPRGEAFAAWRRFLEALAEQRPLSSSSRTCTGPTTGLLDFVDELVDWVSDVPLLVVCRARPELLDRRPGWGGGKLNASTIALAPLSDGQTARLIAHLLERSLLPAESSRRCSSARKATRSTPSSSRSCTSSAAPRTSCRFPRRCRASSPPASTACRPRRRRSSTRGGRRQGLLGGRARHGRGRHGAGLPTPWSERASCAGSAARRSRARSSSRSRTRSCATSRTGRLPRAERADKHRAVAGVDRVPRPHRDHAEMLAYHWRSALELAPAAGDDNAELDERDAARPRDAGDRAFALNAFGPLWRTTPRRSHSGRPRHRGGRVLFRTAHALYVTGRRRAGGSARGGPRRPAHDRRPRDRRPRPRRFSRERRGTAGAARTTQRHIERAQELVADAGTTVGEGSRARLLARLRMLSSEGEDAIRIGMEALAMAEALDLDELRIHALTTIGIAKTLLETHRRRGARARVELAKAANSPLAASSSTTSASWPSTRRGARSRRGARQGDARPRATLGDRENIRFSDANLLCHSMPGRWDEALENADRFIAECETLAALLGGHRPGDARPCPLGARRRRRRARGLERALALAARKRIRRDSRGPSRVAAVRSRCSGDDEARASSARGRARPGRPRAGSHARQCSRRLRRSV